MYYSSHHPYYYQFHQPYGFRYDRLIVDPYSEQYLCIEKQWATYHLTDGSVISFYFDSIGTDGQVIGKIRRKNVRVTCQGKVIQNAHQARQCMNQQVEIILLNGTSINVILKSFDDRYIGVKFFIGDFLSYIGPLFNQPTICSVTEPEEDRLFPAYFPLYSQQPSGNLIRENINSFVPDWIYQSIRTKLSSPDLIKKEEISLIKLNMARYPNDMDRARIAAFVNVDNKEGVFVLYEKVNGMYQEVYEKKLPILGVQVFHNHNHEILITARIGSGTGLIRDEHYVLRNTAKGFKEVWSAIAISMQMLTEAPPHFYIFGNVSFDFAQDHLIYFQLKEVYTKDDFIYPKERECHFEIYKYNVNDAKYDLVSKTS
ncbi:hypothetical protein V7075_10260 [Neobacillus drentensis]|uniref:hypothetical protein n=1 Tax=Neobacillus drentensis TaxID=220684 RepID=UPI002FFE3DC5